MFIPKKIFYEPGILNYPLGKDLIEKYKDKKVSFTTIDNHNSIKELQIMPNSEFKNMKKYLIIGTRKTHKYVPNKKISDFLVPYTSSGCSAMCLYCYLVCNYNKCSYLRIFVNREEMMEKLIKTSKKSEEDLVFEIGSNSDLVLENTITNNLPWTIETFCREQKGYITFPTKFSMVEPILNIKHNKRCIIRMSLNPEEIINTIELGTSKLNSRIDALNKLAEAEYKIGILIAPIIMIDNWKYYYEKLIQTMNNNLSDKVKKNVFFEIIFMSYSYVQNEINKDAFPSSPNLYNKSLMTSGGIGKYYYKTSVKEDGEKFIRELINIYFPNNKIIYVA